MRSDTKDINSKKIESLTLRLPQDTLDKLKGDAEKRKVSVNALTSQIISTYVEWDMNATDAGWAIMPKDALKEIFELLDEKPLGEIAIRTADHAKEIFLMMSGRPTLDAFYSILRHRMTKSNFPYRELEEKGERRFIIQHNMNKQWSTFYKVFYERILNNIGYAARVEFTNNVLILSIDEGRK